jgi:hypothetical protein
VNLYTGSVYGPEVSASQNSNEYSGSIKGEEFFAMVRQTLKLYCAVLWIIVSKETTNKY